MRRIKSPTGYHAEQNTTDYNIWLYGAVGIDFNVQSLLRNLSGIPDGVTNLNIYMHSPGGLVYEGYALLTNLMRLRGAYTLTGYIDGLAASMMSAIAMAMDEVVASPTSKMIIHDPMFGLDIWGHFNRNRIKELIEDLESIEKDLESDSDLIASLYAHKTGRSREEVKALWLNDGKDHGFNPDEMIAEGLADRVATEVLPQPPEWIELEEDSWTSGALAGLKAAMLIPSDPDIYRGQHEKVLQKFSFVKKLHKLEPDLNNNTDMNIASTLANRFGVETASVENILAAYDSQLQASLQREQGETRRLNELIAEYKANLESKETDLTQLRDELRTQKRTSVVDSVIEKVQGSIHDKIVNPRVRERLGELAIDHLQALENEDQARADNLIEHMELLASNHLVPVGDDPALRDDPTSRTTEGDMQEKLEDARKRGEGMLAKQKKLWNTNSN